ncbi:hypothetical protein C4B63_7g382 [Trypanosoma cruzi]|uniref:HECT domain-containing protein n=1 Tax=Trypanosoma cruzi TaxID=5693 RepID=A0A2V2VX90_TRYCR|nr:hypothetical protein C4B63_7g382 [Trypanosoma cruzi]
MFFAFDGGPGKTPYENLLDLCTVLFIAEEGSELPLQRVFHAINDSLQRAEEDGDVLVLAARALALILDRFSRSLLISGNSDASRAVKKCAETVFSVVKKRHVNFRYTKMSERELSEELLTCFSLARNSREVAAVAPSTAEQLKFCFNALDESKWTSCRVLKHCIGLMRRGELKTAGDHEKILQLLQHHLASLCYVDIDHEWDDLLRTVVEGILTYRVWCATQLPLRKRRRASGGGSNAMKTTGIIFDGAPLNNTTEALLAIGERILFSGTAECRMELTLACLASLVETSSLSMEATEKAIVWVSRLLKQNSTRVAGFSNPFVRSRQDAAKREHLRTSPFQALPNLQWIVPPLTWSSLVLLSKLCGANFGFCGEYMWAWRGEGGEYYPYLRGTRQKLTAMFFAADKNKKVLQKRHVIDLCTMTDTSALTLVVSRVYFQPIPSVVVFDGALSIPPVYTHISEELSALLQDALRPLSFGHSRTAYLARAIRLHVICGGAPTNSEDVITAFRSLSAEQKRPVVEAISSALMQHDKRWAPVLLEAGVADALTAFPASAVSKKAAVTTSSEQKGPPVADLIRSAGSSPRVVAMKIPPVTELPSFLSHASPAELLAFIEALEDSTLSISSLKRVCSEIDLDPQLVCRVRDAAHTYVLRILHQTSVAHQEVKSLARRVSGFSHFIGICRPTQGGMNHVLCPKGHPLCVHFSVNWRCNVCANSNSFGSLACRECDYDLCSDCSNTKLSRMDVNVSALVGDIIRYWREFRGDELSDGGSSQRELKHSVLFTSKGVLSAGLSSSTLQGEDVHYAEMGNCCECNISVPLLVANSMGHDVLDSPLQVFLRTFGPLHQWGEIESAIVEVLESCGGEIFESGVSGIPVPVVRVLQAISPYISLSFKRDTAHFLSVGCYRFGLYHLQDVNASVRGTVMGEIESNGLATKFTVKRETGAMTQALFNAFVQYPSIRNKVEFNFEGEEGTGEGPTQELYTELSQRYREMATLWHERNDGALEAFPTLRQVHKKEFFVLGASCGRAFVDGYTMNVSLIPLAWPFIRSASVSMKNKWTLLIELEPELANTYKHMVRSTDAELKEMDLEDENGAVLTTATVKAYVERRVEESLSHAILNLYWFSLGISSVIDLRAFWFLSDDEMSVILCGASRESTEEQLFGEEALRSAIVEAHGYSGGSREVAMMISVVGGEFTREEQQFFLEFLTGSPRLPLNGLAGLGRKITVVRKELEGSGEQTLPSCNTCFLYFKLPPYTSRAVMKARLLTAITEGRKNFSLS